MPGAVRFRNQHFAAFNPVRALREHRRETASERNRRKALRMTAQNDEVRFFQIQNGAAVKKKLLKAVFNLPDLPLRAASLVFGLSD